MDKQRPSRPKLIDSLYQLARSTAAAAAIICLLVACFVVIAYASRASHIAPGLIRQPPPHKRYTTGIYAATMLATVRKRGGGSKGDNEDGNITPGAGGGSDDHQAGAPAPSTPTYHNGTSNGSNGNGGSGGSSSAFGAEPMTPSPVAASITAIPRDHARGVDAEVSVQCGGAWK